MRHEAYSLATALGQLIFGLAIVTVGVLLIVKGARNRRANRQLDLAEANTVAGQGD